MGQELFPSGVDGEIYYVPRIDLLSAAEGGPLGVIIDGETDDEVWTLTTFHGWNGYASLVQAPPSGPEDFDLSWAAVADPEHIYLAWRIVDDDLSRQEADLCQAWKDDCLDVIFDFLGVGPDCTTCRLLPTNIEILIPYIPQAAGDPAELPVGAWRGNSCFFGGIAPEWIQGNVTPYISENGLPGWQGEVAIALQHPAGDWNVDPQHGATLGFNFAVYEDDFGGVFDHYPTWSKRDSLYGDAWLDPSRLGRMQIFDPNLPLFSVTRDLPEDLENGGSGKVALRVTPVHKSGKVTIREMLPPGLEATEPSGIGRIEGDAVVWDLGTVNQETVLTYTLTVDADTIDARLGGIALVDGREVRIFGDINYQGSDFSSEGFIKLWNHLGPLAFNYPAQSGDHGPNPPGGCDGIQGRDLALDWIVNEGETVTQENIRPFPGMLVRPKYGGDGVVPNGTGARAAGLAVGPGDTGLVVRDRFPYWKGVRSQDPTIDYSIPEIQGMNADDHLTMSCTYVTNHTGEDIVTEIGLGSDDSIEVWVGESPLFLVSICRGSGWQGEEQNVVPVVLPPGESRLLLKVTDGYSRCGFRLRFRDPENPDGPGLLPPRITVSLEPQEGRAPARVVRTLDPAVIEPQGESNVSLAVHAMLPGTDLLVREVLPPGTKAESISDGGILTKAGDAIDWSFTGVTERRLTYRVRQVGCARELLFGQSTYRVGEREGVVMGADRLTSRPLRRDDPAPWSVTDLGPSQGALESVAPGGFFMESSGKGIQIGQDDLTFLHLPASGDFEIRVRVDCIDAPSSTGRGGLMVRESLDPAAATAFFAAQANSTGRSPYGLRANRRRETGPKVPLSAITVAENQLVALPVTLRLRRTGDELLFEHSRDGESFTKGASLLIGAGRDLIQLGKEVLVGVALHGGGNPARFLFSDAQLEVKSPAPRFRRGDVDSNGALEITDAVRTLSFLFLGEGDPDCLEAADTNDDGAVDISDAIASLAYQFTGGEPPAAPGPQGCGEDPAGTFLGCHRPCP